MTDLAHYRRFLRVNKHTLDDDLELQSQYQDEISRELSLATTYMNTCKDALDQEVASVIEELKRDKVSETLAAGLAKKDPRRQVLWKEYQQAREEHEQWVGLYDAWQRRGYSIKTLADLYSSQYFTVNSVEGRSDTVSKHRALMAEARKPLPGKEDNDTPVVRRRTSHGSV